MKRKSFYFINLIFKKIKEELEKDFPNTSHEWTVENSIAKISHRAMCNIWQHPIVQSVYYHAICKTAVSYRACCMLRISYRTICTIEISYCAICKIVFCYRAICKIQICCRDICKVAATYCAISKLAISYMLS